MKWSDIEIDVCDFLYDLTFEMGYAKTDVIKCFL